MLYILFTLRKKVLLILTLVFITSILISDIVFADNSIAQIKQDSTLVYHRIDVSHCQGNIKWFELKKEKINFAFVKATDGNFELDPRFPIT